MTNCTRTLTASRYLFLMRLEPRGYVYEYALYLSYHSRLLRHCTILRLINISGRECRPRKILALFNISKRMLSRKIVLRTFGRRLTRRLTAYRIPVVRALRLTGAGLTLRFYRTRIRTSTLISMRLLTFRLRRIRLDLSIVAIIAR